MKSTRWLFVLGIVLSGVASPAFGNDGNLSVKIDEIFLNKFAAWKICPLAYTEKISIDGSLDEWDQSPGIDLPAIPTQVRISGWQGERDLSARIHAAWDRKHLYLAVKVRDNHHHAFGGADLWRGGLYSGRIRPQGPLRPGIRLLPCLRQTVRA